MPRENEEIILILISGTIILTVLSFFIIFFVVYYKKKAKKQREEKEKMSIRFKQELLQTQLEIQEQTLKTISQEIHDNIGQALTLAKLNMSTMLPVADKNLESKIINSKELVGQAISDLRDLSHSLDTDYVQDMGLQRAIEYELERIQRSGIINVSMEVEGTAYRLSKQKELILFRIVQESFTNTLKHAEAKSIRIFLRYTAGQLELTVADDGKGYNLSERKANSGVGTRNIQNRSDLIGASLSVLSSFENGTSINIVLPIDNLKNDSQ